MSVKIIQGDSRYVLQTMPDESAHCVVTSPPYWMLRDYGVPGQIGLEASPQAYVDCMVSVFDEARRVLRNDGTLWLNLGDSYAQGEVRHRNGKDSPTMEAGEWEVATAQTGRKQSHGLKAKDLIGMPWRVALALQEAGWWLRQDIIWAKPNPMPESVLDRCTKAHEYIFLLSKSERYYYDQAAIAEPSEYAGEQAGICRGTKRRATAMGREPTGNEKLGANWIQPETRNKRSVWTVTTHSFNEAHFATFPPDLIEPCILAGCPEGGTVLDPFGGAGTTGLVADRHHRSAILIELNPEYAEMAKKRIFGDAPLFTEVETLAIGPESL